LLDWGAAVVSKSIRLRIALGFGLMLALLLVVSWTNRGSIQAYEKNANLVDQSNQVHGALASFLAALADAESGQSRYLLTTDERQLERNAVAVTQIRARQSELSRLIEDAEQRIRLAELERLTDLRLVEMQAVIDLSRTKDVQAAMSRIGEGRGTAAMNAIRLLAEKMLREERFRLEERQARALESRAFILRVGWLTTLGGLIMVIAAGTLLTRSITRPLEELSKSTERIGAGDFEHRAQLQGQDELAALAMAFNRMAEQLALARARSARVDWAKNESARIAELMQGHPTVEALGETLLPDLARTVEASHAVLYVRDAMMFRRVAAYGSGEEAPVELTGLAQQVSRTGKEVWMRPAPAGMRLKTSLAEGPLGELVILPARFDEVTWGVIELASPQALDEQSRTVLRRAAQFLAIVLRSLDGNERLRVLLEEARLLNRDLVSQQSELEASGRRLESQQDELQKLNEQLEEKARLLSARNSELEKKNEQLEHARAEVESKAVQLARSTRFKSEFLANVSHELRTPLNSQLILARLLEENPEHNLTAKQMEYVSTILKSGRELLRLINDVLDLSKIEAGRMNVVSEPVNVESLVRELERTFRDLPRHPGVALSFEIESTAPREIVTDPHRLRQILANLLGNAIKFTHAGSVLLRVAAPMPGAKLHSPHLVGATRMIGFWVADTGIGISPNEQAAVFEAFRQGDGSTSRTYGGTGLGLSISRELATLLGGEIQLKSAPGVGSTFSVILPDRIGESSPPWARSSIDAPTLERTMSEVPVARDVTVIAPAPISDRPRTLARTRLTNMVVLVIDADVRSVFGITATLERAGLIVLYAEDGASGLSQLASAGVVLIDLGLPDVDGIEAIQQIRQRHPLLPLVAMAGDTSQRERAIAAGAIELLAKPIDVEQVLSLLDDAAASADQVA